PLSDLPRFARAQRLPAARHPVGRGRCGACHAQGRSLPSGVGARAVARWRISARASAEPRRFLHAADYPRLWLRARGAGDVPEVSSDLRLARADGKPADNEALSRVPSRRAARSNMRGDGRCRTARNTKAGTVSLVFRGGEPIKLTAPTNLQHPS